MNVANVQEFKFEKITDKDLGNMYLLFDEALVVRSSSSILFFKINHGDDSGEPGTGLWEQYHELPDMRGNIYFIRGNIRIQVCTDDYIYFFKICKETFQPTLENVMYNNMSCSVMMFGARVRFGVTYKANQPDFTIYTRKFGHNFKVPVDVADHEGAIGYSLKILKRYVVAHGISLTVYDEHTFKNEDRHSGAKLQTFKVPGDREKNVEVLHMVASADDRRLALGIGRNLTKGRQETTEIVIYRYNDDD